MKKIVSIVFSLLLILSCFAGCDSLSDTDNNDSYEQNNSSITSSNDAIEKIKNHTLTELDIAITLGFNNYYPPRYGTSHAEQNDDNSWNVTINGTMSGYTDEYHDDFERKKFTVTATVSELGTVYSLDVEEVND